MSGQGFHRAKKLQLMACTRLSLCAGAGPELAEQADIARSGLRGKGLKPALILNQSPREAREFWREWLESSLC